MKDYPYIRQLEPPLDDKQLRPLDARCRVVQFSSPLSDAEFRRVADFMRGYPGVSFRVYGHYRDGCNLDFLKHFPFVRQFQVDVFDLQDIDGLRLSLDIKLGGTKDLALLPEISHLRYLELWMIRGVNDISSVGDLRALQYLFLQALKNVESVPSLRNLHLLRRVHLETMKGLSDLQPIADATVLEELLVLDMPHLQPESFRPFVGHNTLRSASVGLGSLKKNAVVDSMLGLPDVESLKGEFDYR